MTFLVHFVTEDCNWEMHPKMARFKHSARFACSEMLILVILDTFRLINQGPGLPPLARSANVGPFNTAVGGPQRACKLPLEVLHPRTFPSKGGPEGRSGGGLAQCGNLNLERPRTCGRRPFGAGVGETGPRESHLGGPRGSSNGRIEWSSVGRPGQRGQTGPLIN